MNKLLFSIFAILAIYCQAQQNLRIATDPSNPPFESLDPAGAITGLDIDFLGAVAAASAGAIQYELVPLAWADLFNQVANAQVDAAISAITINDERLATYDFSVPYYLSTAKILAREGTPIASAQDLVTLNQIVGVRDGTTAAGAVEGILGADNPNIRRYANFNDAVLALNNGEVNAVVDDSGLVEYHANNNPGFVVITDADAFAEELYGLMFPKGSALKAVFDPAITTVLENGEYARIYTQWLGATPDVDLLLRAGELEDPYDVFNEGEENEFGNEGNEEEWEWDLEAIILDAINTSV